MGPKRMREGGPIRVTIFSRSGSYPNLYNERNDPMYARPGSQRPEGWARAIPNITELTEQIRGHFKDAAIVHLQPREISSMADSMKLWATSDVIITPHGGNMAMIPGCNFELRSLIRSNFDSESNK